MDLIDADVPELIGALADRLRDHEFSTREALVIACDLLADAMDRPHEFADIMELSTIH